VSATRGPDLNDAALFARVVDKGSFTAAAESMGLQVSTVSRRVARLEAQLGSRLLHRTTRKLSLTDAGRTYHGMASAGLEQLDAAAAAILDLQSELRGLIRFTSVPGMGRFAWELVERFIVDNPKVSIEMDLTERTVDLVGGGYDVALRTGTLPDSSLISKRVAESRFALFAGPEYLESRGPVDSPEALAGHECIIFGMSTQGASWELSSGRKRQQLPVSGRLATTSVETILHACLGGFGVGHLPIDLCRPFVEEGRLVRVLPEWSGAVYGLFVVYPSRQHVSPSVRAFIEFLGEQAEASLLSSVQGQAKGRGAPTTSSPS